VTDDARDMFPAAGAIEINPPASPWQRWEGVPRSRLVNREGPRGAFTITPEGLQAIEDCASNGVPLSSICNALLGIDRSTWHALAKRQPAAKEAWRKGQGRVLGLALGTIAKRAQSGDLLASIVYAKFNGYRDNGPQLAPDWDDSETGMGGGGVLIVPPKVTLEEFQRECNAFRELVAPGGSHDPTSSEWQSFLRRRDMFLAARSALRDYLAAAADDVPETVQDAAEAAESITLPD
jgi:hypothetical protein